MKFLCAIVLILLIANSGLSCIPNISFIKTKSIYGKIMTETKEIIPNAKIQIYNNTDKGEVILAETISDENGRFEIKGFPKGKYMIRANAENFTYSYASMKLQKSSSTAKSKEIVFILVPNGDCSGSVEMHKIQKTK